MASRRSLRASTVGVAAALALTAATQPASGSGSGGRALLWENRGQAAEEGAAFYLGVQGDIVVASGQVCGELTSCDWFVRGHNAGTGATIWEDRVDLAGGFDRTQHMVVDSSRVFASGWLQKAGGKVDFVVRAYDLQRGTLLWSRQIDRGGLIERALVVGAGGGRVFAAGRVNGPTGSSDFTVIALDARTGKVLWESVTDSGQLQRDFAFAVSPRGDQVFVSGSLREFSSMLVRAYDGRTGSILWQDEVLDANNVVLKESLVAHGALLFASGSQQAPSGEFDFIVRAYDARSGALRWSDRVHDVGGYGQAGNLAAAGGRLVASGLAGCDADFLDCDLLVRAYDPETGILLWQDRAQAPGGDWFVLTTDTDGVQAYVGGGMLNENGNYEWSVRAYRADTGQLLWRDEVDYGGTHTRVEGVKVRGDRAFAAGIAIDANQLATFTVRAYETGRSRG